MSASFASDTKLGHEGKTEAPPTLVEQEPEDVQDLMKYEFAKLHKDFRALENNRHGWMMDGGGMRVRTNHLIPLLDKDRKDLRCELRIATSPHHTGKVTGYSNTMKYALQTYELYKEEIAKKIKQIFEIEKHVDKITEKVVKQQYKTIAMFGPSTTLGHREKKLRIAEDKLYQLTCACNLQMHANKVMRDEINDLLRERTRFFKDHRLLKRQLARTRNKMLRIVQSAIHTYDARDESVNKLKSLREREAKESKQFGLELQEFKRNFHHYNEVLTFIRIKLRKREVYEQDKEKKIRIGQQKERELDTILRQYKRSFYRILAYSHTRSITELVEHFRSLDLSNFEAFKYVTNLNSECEVLRESIEKLKTQIEEAHEEAERIKRMQREEQEKLQLAIISHQELIFQLQEQRRKNERRIKDIIDNLTKAMKEAECDKGPIFAFLGSKGKIGAHNIGLGIAQLDFKITEMKHELEQLQDMKNVAAGTSVQAFKSSDYQKTKFQPSMGGPYFPKIYMFNVDSMDEDEKILEEEPYYFKELREFLYIKMVEDRVIDTSTRTISERLSIDLNPPVPPKPQDGAKARKTLSEKIQMSGRKTRHTQYMATEHLSARGSSRTPIRSVSKGKSLVDVLGATSHADDDDDDGLDAYAHYTEDPYQLHLIDDANQEEEGAEENQINGEHEQEEEEEQQEEGTEEQDA